MISRCPSSTRAVLACAVIAVLIGFLGLGTALAQADQERALQAKIDRKEFFEHLAKAEQGDAKSQGNVAARYHMGHGVQKDFAEAVKWYRTSAKQGNTIAQNGLGCCYWCGHGVPQDFELAVKWFRTASEHGNYGAMRNLAHCYRDAQGVDRDYVEAYAWFDLANKTIKPEERIPGEKDRNRENLEEKMSPEQIAAGQIRSQELREQTAAKLKNSGK